jgi:hypothetical protein
MQLAWPVVKMQWELGSNRLWPHSGLEGEESVVELALETETETQLSGYCVGQHVLRGRGGAGSCTPRGAAT